MELVTATEADKCERDRLTYSAWGAGIDIEQFLEREQRLRRHPWAREAMTTWLLRRDAESVLSSCETFRMTSMNHGQIGVTYGIASVFTERALRGRRYASALLERLVPELHRAPNSHGSILFSDVGAALYQRAGYEPCPARDWVFPTEDGPSAGGIDQLFGENDLPDVLAQVRAPDAPFVVMPTAAQLDWHLERERTYAGLLKRPRPQACGARAGRSTILWAAKFATSELLILLEDFEDRAAAEALMLAARRTAYQVGLARVRSWECPTSFQRPAGFARGVAQQRSGELPMLHPFSPGLRVQHWTWIPRATWV